MERLIADLGLADRIRLIGETDDVPGFLGSIDTLVVPSVGKEAQPTAIIEALTHGIPVIVRDPLYSPDFDGLPVARLRLRGRHWPRRCVRRARRRRRLDELIARFGPEQAIAGVDAAAQLARARS